MKKIIFIITMFATTAVYAQERYLFYMHNMWVELYGLEGVHPEFGRTQYLEVLDKFRQEGVVVISEQRPKGTNGNIYAVKVSKQIDSLLKKGVPASHITVAGTSKGAYITMFVSGIMKNTEINYVIIGVCTGNEVMDDSVHLFGNILSVYEKSDIYHSCQKVKAKPGNDVKHFKEIELQTGLKHGFLYQAMDEWIKPTAAWAKGNYK